MNPLERRDGRLYLTGTGVSLQRIEEAMALDQEPWVVAREYGVPIEAVEFAVAYLRKRQTRLARKAHDPKRPQRLKGKRNAAAGRRAEEWVEQHLGPAWVRLAGVGRVDIRYRGTCPEPVVRTLEVKRRKGADKTLRLMLVQNGVDALVRTYGAEPGVRQVEPVVVMRWSTWRALLQRAGQEVT